MDAPLKTIELPATQQARSMQRLVNRLVVAFGGGVNSTAKSSCF